MIEQYGALPWRYREDGELEILLVTSRQTGRWVAPKGNPIPGRVPHDSAAREAFEEAGVEGATHPEPLGAYRYTKRWRFFLPVRAKVRLYPLRVERLLDRWPEERQRRRQWFFRAEAARLVRERQLKRLILAFRPEGLSTPPR